MVNITDRAADNLSAGGRIRTFDTRRGRALRGDGQPIVLACGRLGLSGLLGPVRQREAADFPDDADRFEARVPSLLDAAEGVIAKGVPLDQALVVLSKIQDRCKSVAREFVRLSDEVDAAFGKQLERLSKGKK